MAGRRRKGREVALKALYQAAVAVERDFAVLEETIRSEIDDPRARAQAREAVKGVLERLEEIDARLRSAATNWSPERMAAVDLAILRLAAWEILFSDDVPPKVAISEAVDLAGEYGTRDSGAFVNGVLDRILRDEQGRPARKDAE